MALVIYFHIPVVWLSMMYGPRLLGVTSEALSSFLTILAHHGKIFINV